MIRTVGAIGTLPQRARQTRAMRAFCAATRTLVLTFDDGPGERLTANILRLLDEFGARATFFALGCRAERSTRLMDEVLAQGHEVGCHTYAHQNAWRNSAGRSVEDVRRGFEVLSPWLGPRPLFRPPYGKLTAATKRAAKVRGARIGWWTHATNDTAAAAPDPNLATEPVIRNEGGVVLMHDFDRGEHRHALVMAMTHRLLRSAAERGWRVLTLSELLDEMAHEPNRSADGVDHRAWSAGAS